MTATPHASGVEGADTPSAPREPVFVRGHWLLGMGPDILRRPLEMLSELGRMGDVVRFRLPAMPAVLVNHPDLVKRIFHDPRTYDKRMRSYKRVSPLVGNGLATSEGDFWLRQRRIAQPAFHRQRIAGFGDLMVRLTEATCDGFLSRARRGEPFDFASEMTQLTLSVMCEAMFGGGVPGDTEILARAYGEVLQYLVERLNLLWYLPLWVPTTANRRCRAALSALDGVIYRMIARRRAQGGEGSDLLSMLLNARDEETGQGMSDAELRDEVATMLLGGHETTAMTLTWAVYLLAQHPDAQDCLRAELSEVLGERPLTLEDLARLSYTRMVIDETMRLYPPIWLVARNAAKDDDLGGYRISKGDSVFVSPWAVHRSPSLWDAPHEFRPERFSPEREAALHPYAFFPFAGGPRQCIGNAFASMESRLVLAVLARRYRFSLTPGSLVVPEPTLSLRPRDGVKVLLHPGFP